MPAPLAAPVAAPVAAPTTSCLTPSPAARQGAGTASFDAVMAAARADRIAQRFDDAAARFRSVAFGRADASLGLEATALYLELLAFLGGSRGRTACYEDVEREVPLLRDAWCRQEHGHSESDACVLVDNAYFDIVRLHASRFVEQADAKTDPARDPAAAQLYERAGQTFFGAFREACDEPALAGKPNRLRYPGHCEELAYNAAKAFAAAHMRAKAIATYRAVVAYGDRVGEGALAGRATRELALSYQAIALYDLAADWHERYATRFPTDQDAPPSMIDATILRLGLGQDDRALTNRAFFLKTWGSKRPRDTAQLALAFAELHFERDENDRARAELAAAMVRLDQSPIDLRVRAHALVAKVTPARASVEWATVRSLWADPARAEATLRAAWPMEESWRVDRRLAKALSAVGEAIFAGAEDKRAEQLALKYPAFRRTADRAGVEAFARDDVKEWLDKKRAAIEGLEPEFTKVLDIKPLPPPKSVIAATAAVAKMWAALADELRRPPVSVAWRRDPSLERAYVVAVSPMLDSVTRTRAKPAMQRCLDLAVKYQLADSAARDCEAWLVARYPDEYHRVDELAPGLRAGPRAAQVAPLAAPPRTP